MAHQVQECPRELVTPRGSAWWERVALDDVDEAALVPVQLVVLATDCAHLERVAVQLTRFL